MRQVVVYPGEDGYWIAESPSLSGCISQGKIKEEAIANIKEAIEGYVAALEEDGLPVPEERLDACKNPLHNSAVGPGGSEGPHVLHPSDSSKGIMSG